MKKSPYNKIYRFSIDKETPFKYAYGDKTINWITIKTIGKKYRYGEE